MPDDAVLPSASAGMIGGVIPVLDVARYLAGEADALPALGRTLRYAFQHVGFYYLRGHGVPHALIGGEVYRNNFSKMLVVAYNDARWFSHYVRCRPGRA